MNTSFTVYDPSTGKILYTGFCQTEHLAEQGNGYPVVEGNFDGSLYYWDSTQGFVSIPSKPITTKIIEFSYTTKSWEINTQQTIDFNRALRNSYLTKTDWTQGVDSPLSSTDKTAWASYRQALRDMVDQGFLNSNFPTAPTT